jgi:Mrp family chromosome partitioning ATPase/uncharacterized protein involved in exopolysaccharide biosynthesis
MKPQTNSTTLAERITDTPMETFSLRDLISRIFLRPKLFLFALLVPAIVALLISSLVPVEWAASTKILIRYSGSDTALLKELVPDARLGLSGTTSAALIKSTPVIEKTIYSVGIKQEDIYKKPLDVIRDKVFGIFKTDDEGGAQTASKRELDNLVSGFKASLDSSSKKSSSDKSIEILEKTSQVPESLKLDELISLEVKSFNREKVASMSNGLANAFIDEYYRLYAEEASKQHQYLDALVKKQESELSSIERAGPADFKSSVTIDKGGSAMQMRDDAIINSMSAQLTTIESQLSTASQVYSGSSPQVQRLRSQAANLKFQLKKQEAVENSKGLLEQLKTRRYQAVNIESIYKNRLIPISIAELANTPSKSSSKKLVRLAVSGIIGLILGTMLAISLMIVLNVIDSRIHFSRDIEQLSSVPVVAQVPMLGGKIKLTDYLTIRQEKTIEHSFMQIITKIGRKKQTQQANVFVVSSPSIGDGASFCALSLAMTLAKNKSQRVCLIDANFVDSAISTCFNLSEQNGLIEALIDQTNHIQYDEQLSLSILGAGKTNMRGELGYYTENANLLLTSLRKQFDYIVIDAGSALHSNESAILGALADEVLLVVSSGLTRKGALQTALSKMSESGVIVSGIVMNKTKSVLPKFIYNSL